MLLQRLEDMLLLGLELKGVVAFANVIKSANGFDEAGCSDLRGDTNMNTPQRCVLIGL